MFCTAVCGRRSTYMKPLQSLFSCIQLCIDMGLSHSTHQSPYDSMSREVMPSLRSRAALVQSAVHSGQSAADDLLQHHMRHLMRSRSSSSSSSRRSSTSSFGRSRSRGFGGSSFGGDTTGGSIGVLLSLCSLAILVTRYPHIFIDGSLLG